MNSWKGVQLEHHNVDGESDSSTARGAEKRFRKRRGKHMEV